MVPIAAALSAQTITKRSIVDIERAAAESRILQELRHPFVVSLHYAFQVQPPIEPPFARGYD